MPIPRNRLVNDAPARVRHSPRSSISRFEESKAFFLEPPGRQFPGTAFDSRIAESAAFLFESSREDKFRAPGSILESRIYTLRPLLSFASAPIRNGSSVDVPIPGRRHGATLPTNLSPRVAFGFRPIFYVFRVAMASATTGISIHFAVADGVTK